MSALTSSLNFADRIKQEEEVQAAKKQLRQKEALFEKEKALLVQKVELLEMQLNEAGEREEGLKKTCDKYMAMLHGDPDESGEFTKLDHHEQVSKLTEENQKMQQDYSTKLQQL